MRPTIPSPGVSTTSVGMLSVSPLALASATMVSAMMCFEAWSSEAAIRNSSSGVQWSAVCVDTNLAWPAVRVPVLSMTSARTRASVSIALPPLIKMPALAARDSPATIATGTARISGQGVATTSTATARTASPVSAQAIPASATVTARNAIA